MISKVELWVNNDSTGIQDLNSFSILWNTKDYKNSSYDILSGPMICKAKSLIVGLLQSQLAISLVFSKTFGSNEKSELGRSIIQTIDSGFVMLGEVDNDILLMKSNRYGDMEWQTIVWR